MLLRQILMTVVGVCVIALRAPAETFSVASYNIEHFEERFAAYKLSKSPDAKSSELVKQLLESERKQNEEDQWEISQVIADPAFNPDILVIEEGCSESNLKYFNKRWLSEAYKTIIVFKTNTDRDQNLCLMMKPGFKVVARKDKYFEETDASAGNKGGKLFARGPAFVLVETPGGYRLWVGVTHQKSKFDNSVVVSAWRNREAVRTHEIMKELAKAGPEDVILLGDMNDEVGLDEFEKDPKSGGDSIPHLVGPPADGFILATEPLVKSGENSFGGYWNPKYRSLIDHAVTTPSMKGQIQSVSLFKGSLSAVASDHFPLLLKIQSDAAKGSKPTGPSSGVEKPATRN